MYNTERRRVRAGGLGDAGKVACGVFGFDGDGERTKKGGCFSESDCTVREGGGVYPANRAQEWKASYPQQQQKQQ